MKKIEVLVSNYGIGLYVFHVLFDDGVKHDYECSLLAFNKLVQLWEMSGYTIIYVIN